MYASRIRLTHGLLPFGMGMKDMQARPFALWRGLPPHLSIVNFVGRPESFSDDWQKVANVIATGAKIWSPLYGAVESNGYSDIKVFKDHPGVGWMLYLPRVLTAQQIPEARSFVPVMGKDAKGNNRQVGTIVVSVTDEPFSDKNHEHVKIANAIEIRMVDQDLLPRFTDL